MHPRNADNLPHPLGSIARRGSGGEGLLGLAPTTNLRAAHQSRSPLSQCGSGKGWQL
jgi:hypothetical protein